MTVIFCEQQGWTPVYFSAQGSIDRYCCTKQQHEPTKYAETIAETKAIGHG
ncbi:hypothetical protein [Ferruginibacter sp.]|uniref:hypothetical protein n=1 Tax=Ferruginibacter sp. TaxID=1940288 RepID=UPI0026596237|nr:hypothetical protein [Ferruginibacter sp.]